MPEFFPTIPIPARVVGRAWVCILQSADGTPYIGQTCDVGERLLTEGLAQLYTLQGRLKTKPQRHLNQ